MRVVALMKAADATVAEAGASALGYIAGWEEETKQAVFEAGGVAVLMEALARHKTSAGVCAQASRALGNIALWSGARAQAVLEALPLLLEALSLHKTHAKVCENVSFALYMIANSETRASIVSVGAVPLLAAVCKDHEGEVRKEARRALDALGYNNDGSKK